MNAVIDLKRRRQRRHSWSHSQPIELKQEVERPVSFLMKSFEVEGPPRFLNAVALQDTVLGAECEVVIDSPLTPA
jgi:hypothetical protein